MGEKAKGTTFSLCGAHNNVQHLNNQLFLQSCCTTISTDGARINPADTFPNPEMKYFTKRVMLLLSLFFKLILNSLHWQNHFG